jgi:X-X-X-Leu-X-X-Gly heptad repeat protein
LKKKETGGSAAGAGQVAAGAGQVAAGAGQVAAGAGQVAPKEKEEEKATAAAFKFQTLQIPAAL